MIMSLRKITMVGIGALIGLLLVSCAKKTPLTDAQKVYAGTWSSGQSYLAISQDGSINYKIVDGNSSTEVQGAGLTIINSTMKVSFLGTERDWKIESAPAQVNGVWTMTVDGITYTKK